MGKWTNLVIAVDFDGTVVKHDYPGIGEPVSGALGTLLELQSEGVKLILWTMRSGETLDAAVRYMVDNGVSLWGINRNPDQEASGWSTSPKAYANFYIDDASVGCPLVLEDSGRPYVDWEAISDELRLIGILPKKEEGKPNG